MKSFNRTYLPEAVIYNGIEYKPNARISSAMQLNNTSPNTIQTQLRLQGRKCVQVTVTNKNLRGKTDLHGKPYKPTTYIFTNDNKE